jgi:hypothetical protein
MPGTKKVCERGYLGDEIIDARILRLDVSLESVDFFAGLVK